MTYHKQSYNTQKGFTLVELAIVLVIIGLIVSSVLVGQDLIKAAQLRATTKQFNEFEAAVGTFIGKYNGIPGDLNYGTKFGLYAGTATYQDGTAGAGDGDGTIEEDNAATILTFTGEISTFWSHLTTSGKELITGSYAGIACNPCVAGVNFPLMKFGGFGWGAYGVSGTNYYYAGLAASTTTTATTTANPFVPIDAYDIDRKIDDGLPNSGLVQAGGNVTTTFLTTLAPAAACVAAAEYVFTTTTAACGLRFNMTTF